MLPLRLLEALRPADSPVVTVGAHDENTIASIENRTDHFLESPAEKHVREPRDVTFRAMAVTDSARLIEVLQHLAKRQSSRIGFKAKGRIFFIDPADIVAVEAEGNYVSLHYRSSPYILRESISTIADKLQPYGFIRIHRSVVVNRSLVEEIQPWSTGEYRLRVKGGKEYTVTRTYKKNLKLLAQLWLGAESLCD